MLEALISHRLISPPAIWGKLPGHADFVRSGVRHGESEGWQSWLAEHAAMGVDTAVALPTAFVLPPGSLAFARRHFVVGVVAPSKDRTGRRHPVLIYQRAHPRWVRRHFDAQANHPRDWLFWLARAVGRHAAVRAPGELRTLEWSAHALWQLHGPDWRELGRMRPGEAAPEAKNAPSLAVLDRCIGAAPADASTLKFVGVRHLPWADWPARLHVARAKAAFWQQDAGGGFVNASTRLADLWRHHS